MSNVNMLLLRRRAMMQVAATPTPTASYLTLTAVAAGSTVRLRTLGSAPPSVSLELSTDGTTWSSYTVGDTITLAAIGDYVKFRGVNSTFGSSITSYNRFDITGTVALSGDLTSIINGVGGDAVLSSYCFNRLFYNQSGLVGECRLPATTSGENYTCFGAFYGTSITSAYLALTAPGKNCYYSMFQNCSSLNYIETTMTDISLGNCLLQWVNGVAASGTFKCPSSLEIESGQSGIPNGWTRYNLDGTPYNP